MKTPTTAEYKRVLKLFAKVKSVVEEHGAVEISDETAPNIWPWTDDELQFVIDVMIRMKAH